MSQDVRMTPAPSASAAHSDRVAGSCIPERFSLAESKTANIASSTRPWTSTTYEYIANIIAWKPARVRWSKETPPRFTLSLNYLFAFANACTVANLYYSHPILNILAQDFGVSDEQSSQIPTLAQSGYAVGLLFLNPLGDIFKRRPFVLSLILLTTCFWQSFAVFGALSFITGITTVTPQLMLPLVGDLAPPHRRSAAISVVAAGNLLGILVARLLAGIVTQFTSWRYVYWIAFGLQLLILVLLWNFMPDYPSTNPDGINYFRILWSILVMLKEHPILVQCCLIAVCTSAPFTAYWTTLTFLLADRYGYNPLEVALFALIGVAGIVIMPLFGRKWMDQYVPLLSVLIGIAVALAGVIVGTYSGLYSVAGPAIQAFALDMGLQSCQIANRASIYMVAPTGRNRINTAYMVAVFLGQIMGTAAANSIYAESGWVGSGSLSVALLGAALVIALARGPHERGWMGWRGGWQLQVALAHRGQQQAPQDVDSAAKATAGDGDVEGDGAIHNDTAAAGVALAIQSPVSTKAFESNMSDKKI